MHEKNNSKIHPDGYWDELLNFIVKKNQMKMKIEIWSDVACPFCYIGKRKFESALERFGHKENVEITWRSFRLSPDIKNIPGKDIHDYLADKKGQTREWAQRMNGQVADMGKAVGLKYDFDRVVVANTLDAHRLSQLAAKHDLQNEVEEKLFSAYFSEGKNIADKKTLVELGSESGLDATEINSMLEGNTFSQEVENDENEAAQLGIRGVPFFLFDRKFAVSGAQPEEVFLQALEKALEENI
jgi:predicted DsbA family dithiol-disulfide isomerase